MTVLIAYGSKHGGTKGLAEMLGAALLGHGVPVEVRPCREVRDVSEYDAVVVGGSLYFRRWHRDAVRFVRRFEAALRLRPVWLFSSGPLDETASVEQIPPVPRVAWLARKVRAVEHVTFGGRISPEARGPISRRLAKAATADWRDPEQVEMLAEDVVRHLTASQAPA